MYAAKEYALTPMLFGTGMTVASIDACAVRELRA